MPKMFLKKQWTQLLLEVLSNSLTLPESAENQSMYILHFCYCQILWLWSTSAMEKNLPTYSLPKICFLCSISPHSLVLSFFFFFSFSANNLSPCFSSYQIHSNKFFNLKRMVHTESGGWGTRLGLQRPKLELQVSGGPAVQLFLSLSHSCIK